METLVLNRNFCAIHICDYKKVFSLLFKEHAEVVDENFNQYNFWEWKDYSQAILNNEKVNFIQTPNFKVAIPDVILLKYYDELPSREVLFNRRTIYKHYEHKCAYCGKRFKTEEINMDHVVPRSHGGKTEWNNIVLACVPCNTKKADRTPEQAGMKLLYQPSKPLWRPSFNITTGMKIKPSWAKFIDLVYWNVEIEKG